ncbi:MAG: polysaccharide biosynthesis tyrosine autokinase, partial [Ferruginibacter sp.]
TRVVVNDGEQEKGTNLFQALTFKNTDKETEREKEILQSKLLISEIVRNTQLNIQWTKKGRVTVIPEFDDLPVELWVEKPDSIKDIVRGVVKLLPGKIIEFNGNRYATDTLVQSPFGKIKWLLHDPSQFTNEWTIEILPVNNAANNFRSRLSATPITKQSSIIDLSIIETVPARGVFFLNALLYQYGKNNVSFKNRVYQNTVTFLEDRIRIVSDELGGIESNLQHYKTTEGVYNLSAQGELYLNQLKETDTKAGETEVQLSVLQKIEQYVNTRNHTQESVPATLGLADPILLGLLTQLYQAEFEAEKMGKLSGGKNPQLAVLEESISKLKPSILASIQNLRINLQSTKDKLSDDEKLLKGQLNNMPQKERALLEISRQQQIKNTIYTFLLQKREEAILSAAAQVPNHRVINTPELAGKVQPKPLLAYVMALALALGSVIVFLYLKEFSGNKVMYSSDLERLTAAPLLGELTFSKRSEEETLIKPTERLLISEQLRDLRTNLSYTNIQKEGAQVILITSSISGEGKSFISINLASTLSGAGKKVLLIECDLRKPVIRKKLGITQQKGLVDYLIGGATEEDIVRSVETINNVYLIASGPIAPNPVELLMNGRFQPLMESLKKQFDYILIDSPPAAILTDAKVLAMEADSTLYVLRYNYTPFDFLAFIKEQAKKKTLPRISIVFNGVIRKKVPGYGYGKNYGYAYGYGYVQDEKNSK